MTKRIWIKLSMLVLTPDSERFLDSDNPQLSYHLPAGLTPSRNSHGIPSILIVRHSGGGSISLDLEPHWPQFAANEQAIPISGTRFRMHAHSPARSESGEWHNALPHSKKLVQRTVLLSSVESSIVQRLLTSGDETFSIDVEISLQGRTPIYPWRVSADPSLLIVKLTSLLSTEQSHSHDEIVQAFSALTDTDFKWLPQSPQALPAPTAAALFAIANHAIPILFERDDSGYRFKNDPPQQFSVNLLVPSSATRSAYLNWSLSEFLGQQSNPQQFAYEIAADSPFEVGELLITNDLPLHHSGIRHLDVEIRTGGPSSELNHRFVPSESSAARLEFVEETFRERVMNAKITAVIMKSGRPILINKSVRRVGSVLSLNKELMQIEPTMVRVLDAVFDHLTTVEIQLGSRLITLTRDTPEYWAVRSSPASQANLAGITSAGVRVELGTIAPINGQFTVTEAHLGVGELIEIEFKRSENAPRSAYLAIKTEAGEWRTFEEQELRYGKIQRANKWSGLSISYQTRHVPLANNGGTKAMIESDLKTASSHLITIDL